MDIRAISYNNIGPFFDQKVTVPFVQGATLIKAPIGSGKSFLFFDGPLYALYKTSNRQLLSRNAKQGWIHCIFEHNDTIWYIERQLTMTKAGNDSAQSRLFRVTMDRETLIQAVQALPSYATDSDCKDLIMHDCEEIEASSQRELEDMLKALLPPRELFLSIHLMMQDADHIFELPAGQRINIFKHLFGLLGIDDAKDTLFAKRKEIQTKIAFLEEKETSNDTLRRMLKDLYAFNNTSLFSLPGTIGDAWKNLMDQPFFQDSSLIKADELSIQGFSVEQGVYEALQGVDDAIIATRAVVLKQSGIHEEREKQLKQMQERMTRGRQQQSKVQDQIAQQKKLLENQQENSYDEKQTLLTTLTTKKESIEGSVNIDLFASYGKEVSSFSDTMDVIDERINEGRECAQKIELTQSTLKQLQESEKKIESAFEGLQQQIANTKKNYEQQARFECDKIEGPCPYIDVINKAAILTIKEQGEALQEQKKQLEQQRKEIEERIKTVQKELDVLHEKKQEYGHRLQAVSWKEIKEQSQELIRLQKEIDGVHKDLQKLKELEENRQKNRQQYDSLIMQQGLIQEKLKETEGGYNTLQELIHKQDKTDLPSLDILNSNEQKTKQIKELLSSITALVNEYNKQQKEKFTLAQELGKVKELYQIFSKELLVVVLQDFLPQLEEVINAYLVQVVDYSVRFMSPKSVDDAIELDIEVIDDLGVRSVTSLSGGQRAVLKICWILAVSSLFRSKVLFLDETITSLDPETVARVAEMIHSFVRAHDMKFYVVTHAEKIQEMEIRDSIVTI